VHVYTHAHLIVQVSKQCVSDNRRVHLLLNDVLKKRPSWVARWRLKSTSLLWRLFVCIKEPPSSGAHNTLSPDIENPCASRDHLWLVLTLLRSPLTKQSFEERCPSRWTCVPCHAQLLAVTIRVIWLVGCYDSYHLCLKQVFSTTCQFTQPKHWHWSSVCQIMGIWRVYLRKHYTTCKDAQTPMFCGADNSMVFV